jgi:hypothetical protein
MPRAKKSLFEKNKTYYYPPEDWKIKYVESHEGGLSVAATHYVFKVVGDPEWDVLETTLPDEIYRTKTEYLRQNPQAKVLVKTDTCNNIVPQPLPDVV